MKRTIVRRHCGNVKTAQYKIKKLSALKLYVYGLLGSKIADYVNRVTAECGCAPALFQATNMNRIAIVSCELQHLQP